METHVIQALRSKAVSPLENAVFGPRPRCVHEHDKIVPRQFHRPRIYGSVCSPGSKARSATDCGSPCRYEDSAARPSDGRRRFCKLIVETAQRQIFGARAREYPNEVSRMVGGWHCGGEAHAQVASFIRLPHVHRGVIRRPQMVGDSSARPLPLSGQSGSMAVVSAYSPKPVIQRQPGLSDRGASPPTARGRQCTVEQPSRPHPVPVLLLGRCQQFCSVAARL